MNTVYTPGPNETRSLDTDALRANFLVSELLIPGELRATYTDLDRMIIGGVVPLGDAIALPHAKATGTRYFLERREIGIINLGGPGAIAEGDNTHSLGNKDCLYIGKGVEQVSFSSDNEAFPAQFYFVSTPAHASYPTQLVRRSEVAGDELGEPAKANRRRIVKYIHPDGIKSCQLVMGFTEFESGSVWNTMPPHTHDRRTEVYLYFDLADQVVVHLMGEPTATRHLIVRDKEAVLSPAWSVHCGAGTGNYRFVWAMGGDNQVFSDMDPAPLSTLR